MKKIYISGKVTDGDTCKITAETIAKFAEVEKLISEKLGDVYIVVNPTKLCRFDWSWKDCMLTCISELFNCDAICLLDDWESSRGARIEYKIAQELGLKLLYKSQIGGMF